MTPGALAAELTPPIRQILDTFRDYVVVLDAERNILFVNSRFEEKRVLPDRDKIVNEPFFGAVDSFAAFRDEESFRTAFDLALEQRKEQFVPFLGHESKSGEKHYDFTIAPIFSSKDLIGYVLIFQSLTKLLDEMSDNLEVVTAMAHTLKNVVNNIATEIAHFRQARDDAVLDTVFIELHRIEKLVENIDRLGQRRAPTKTRFLLSTLVSNLRSHYASSFRREIQADIDAQLTLNADEGQIDAVLTNLIDNALEASQPGDKVNVQGTTAGGLAIITISNSGCLVEESILARLNAGEPFVSTKSMRGKGAGLGYYVSKRIVEGLYGGKLIISNDVENTAVIVTLELPLDRA
ncbi:MAG: PAS domain-containing sensor histidine kinase [Thermoplasmata archaeon]|nr:PAS domain-containing sensor histidine kinase [Thermoplasmata archaeon]